MKKIEHKFFGTLVFGSDVDGAIIFETEIDGIDVTVWYEDKVEVSEELLNKAEDFIKNYKKHIQEARKYLVDYLNEDREYMNFHLEELEALNLPTNVLAFVDKMVVTTIDIWIHDVETKLNIIIDYMISPEESDEILAVQFNADAKILDVSWES